MLKYLYCARLGQCKNNSRFVDPNLPEGFHKAISGKIKTMETMKRWIKVGDAMIYDMEALFSRLLIVGQNRKTSLVSVFEYKLCVVPSSIIDEFGFICKGNKANIVKKLAIISTEPCPPDEVIVDGGQLLYHIVWSCGGTISTVATSMATRTKNYSVILTKIIFDRYGNVSAKDLAEPEMLFLLNTTLRSHLLFERETLSWKAKLIRDLSHVYFAHVQCTHIF